MLSSPEIQNSEEKLTATGFALKKLSPELNVLRLWAVWLPAISTMFTLSFVWLLLLNNLLHWLRFMQNVLNWFSLSEKSLHKGCDGNYILILPSFSAHSRSVCFFKSTSFATAYNRWYSGSWSSPVKLGANLTFTFDTRTPLSKLEQDR